MVILWLILLVIAGYGMYRYYYDERSGSYKYIFRRHLPEYDGYVVFKLEYTGDPTNYSLIARSYVAYVLVDDYIEWVPMGVHHLIDAEKYLVDYETAMRIDN